MTKTINATQQSLRLLVYSLAGISIFFIVLRLLTTYVLGSPGMVTAALVLLVSLVWAAQRSQQFRAKNEQEALLMQHRAFAAEVERAWERSHANGLERRKAPTAVAVSVPSHTASTVEGSSKKRKKKKRTEDGDEETFIVDDELEAEVVEDLEDFLEHSRLRQTLKKTADELRVSQKRKEDKKASALAPEEEAKKVPETKAPSIKTKKEAPKVPEPAKGAGNKGVNRERVGEDRSKNHKETKDQPAHRKESTQRTGTNGTKQGWQDEWYGESSWWPEQGQGGQGDWSHWSNDWWTAKGRGANAWSGRKAQWTPKSASGRANGWK